MQLTAAGQAFSADDDAPEEPEDTDLIIQILQTGLSGSPQTPQSC
jgi:hypothetical protein